MTCVLFIYVEALFLTATIAYFSQWSEWDHWSPCNAFCGMGKRLRRRQCVDVSGRASNECGDEDNAMETADCFVQRCPQAASSIAAWDTWYQWSSCDKTCGSGLKHSSRTCLKDTPLGTTITFGCPGDGKKSIKCEIEPCPTEGPPQIKGFADWREWDEWSHCLGKCSHRFRYRECNTYGQQMAWGCRGKHVEYENCGIPSCPKVKEEPQKSRIIHRDDIFWSQWDPWTPCGRTCGGGKMYRKRECHKMKPPHSVVGYHDCGAHDVEDKKCNSQLCPGQKPKPKKVFRGTWSQWAPWHNCNTKCAGGTKERYRTCRDKAGKELGIGECVGGEIQYGDCGDPNCKPKPHVWKPKPPVKKKIAEWTEWGAWWKCTKRCGPGETFRWRECKAGEEYRLAKECGLGAPEESEHCEVKPCPNFFYSGVDWSSWNDWSECSCDKGTRKRYRTCQRKEKYAFGCKGEYMDTSTCSSPSCGNSGSISMPRKGAGSNPGNAGKPSLPNKNNPPKQSSSRSDVNAWSTWKDWSSCTATCGGGSRSRWRQCEGPDQSLAAGCDGEYMDFSDCGSQPCQSGSSSGSSQGSRTSSSQGSSSGSSRGSLSGSSQGSRSGSTQGFHSGSSRGSLPGSSQGSGSDSSQVLRSGSSQGSLSSSSQGSRLIAEKAGMSNTMNQAPSREVGGGEYLGKGGGGGGGGGGGIGTDWGAWNSWQSCTVTCGVGVRMRYRKCTTSSCIGEDVDSEDCVADELCEDSTEISEFEADVGKGVVISCLGNQFVEDHPASKVVWSKNEQPIEMNDRFMLVDLTDLEIKRVEPDDEGVYVCAILSGDKTFNRHVVLLKIHSKSDGGDGGSLIILVSIPIVVIVLIAVVVVIQRRSGTKASGGKSKSKKSKNKSNETESADEDDEQEDDERAA